VTADEFLEMLPDAEIGPEWPEATELGLKARWDNHPLRQAIAKKCANLRENSQEVRLMKGAVKLFNCLPTEILSLDKNMVVVCEARDKTARLAQEVPDYGNVDDRAASYLWSTSFCKAFGRVLFHPSWAKEPRLLRAAIQYTVICATDDRRPWKPDIPPWDVFLLAFTKKTSENNDGKRPRELHQGVLRDILAQPGSDGVGPWWSRLFVAITNLTADVRGAVRGAGGTVFAPDDRPFVVYTSDLECLASAMQRADDRRLSANDTTAPDARLYAKALDAVLLDVLRKDEQRPETKSAGTSDKPGPEEKEERPRVRRRLMRGLQRTSKPSEAESGDTGAGEDLAVTLPDDSQGATSSPGQAGGVILPIRSSHPPEDDPAASSRSGAKKTDTAPKDANEHDKKKLCLLSKKDREYLANYGRS
jgi:hypothetical protein